MDSQKNYSTEYALITGDNILNQCCEAWQSKSYLALDTEFMRTDSFYPKVALIQVCDGEKNYLIDPLRISDWEKFKALMLAPEITKIFHSCSEDLLVFIRQFGLLPSPIFDTQIANSFLNQGFGLSYQNMISEQLDIDIPKGETRSNWLKRPLSVQQLDYAALDVAYLPEIYSRQKKQLAHRNISAWVDEDCQRLGGNYKEELSQDFSQTYRSISAAWQLDKSQLNILKALAEWREIRARQRDKPRNWIIKDKELEDVVSNITRTKSVDIFIHAPTYPTSHRAIMNTEWSEFQKNIELQSKAFFQITKFLVPHMKKQKMGRIISILTSYVVNEPPSGLSDYVVAKYSLLGLSKCMAIELGKFGIRVNSISPSIVNTPLIDKLPSKFKEIVSSQIPLENKFAEPSDVAGLALFLCTDYSNYISGENILLSGGYSMH